MFSFGRIGAASNGLFMPVSGFTGVRKERLKALLVSFNGGRGKSLSTLVTTSGLPFNGIGKTLRPRYIV